MKTHVWESSSGRVSLEMTRDQAESVAHSGDCGPDVTALIPHLRMQLSVINPTALAEELQDYGAWSKKELESHGDNLERLIWLAGNDLYERWEDEETEDAAAYHEKLLTTKEG